MDTKSEGRAPRTPPDGRRYGGLLDHERRAERRERLLRAGLELFGTIGYAKTTIPMLCSEANVAARHFYEDFDSREALLKAIYDQIARSAIELLRATLKDPDVGPLERIRRSNEAYFRYMTSDRRRARIYALESMGVSAEMELHRRATREAFLKIIKPGQTRVIAPLDGRLLSVAVGAAAHGMLLEWLLASNPPSLAAMVDVLTTIWMRTLTLEAR